MVSFSEDLSEMFEASAREEKGFKSRQKQDKQNVFWRKVLNRYIRNLPDR